MTSSTVISTVVRARYGHVLALCLTASVVGCFNDPKVDVSKPIECTNDRYCPWGYICSQGYCCASSDGKTCSSPSVPDGGKAGSAGGTQTDAQGRDTGAGGAGGLDGRAGAGGSAQSDGAQDDYPQGGAGGMGTSGGITGAGGVAGSGGIIVIPGSGGRRDGGATTSVGGSGGGPGGSTPGTGGSGVGGSGVGGSGVGGNGTGGRGTGGSGTGGRISGTGGSGSGGSGTGGSCTGSQKPCNGGCIPIAECCGGCSGDTPVCNNGSCVGRPNGDPCTPSTASQCTSKVCADGVCCNAACTGQCEACNTSANLGTCSPTTTPRTPCATDGSNCGGSCDGTAAHRTACVYPTSSTTCGQPAQCNTVTNQASTAQNCNGAGSCSPASYTSCAPYTCNGTVCGTSCPSGQGVCSGTCVNILTDPTHCGTSCTTCSASKPKCSNGTCVECTQASDCPALGYGAGSVCTGNKCYCRPKSSGNVIANANFDGGLSSWKVDYPDVTQWASGEDADSCKSSGSAHVWYYGFMFGWVIQSVPASSKTYHFGFRYKQMASDPDAVTCYVDAHKGSPSAGECSGDYIQEYQVASGPVPPSGTWGSKALTFLPPTDTSCIYIRCQSTGSADAWIDQVYLNGDAGGYY